MEAYVFYTGRGVDDYERFWLSTQRQTLTFSVQACRNARIALSERLGDAHNFTYEVRGEIHTSRATRPVGGAINTSKVNTTATEDMPEKKNTHKHNSEFRGKNLVSFSQPDGADCSVGVSVIAHTRTHAHTHTHTRTRTHMHLTSPLLFFHRVKGGSGGDVGVGLGSL